MPQELRDQGHMAEFFNRGSGGSYQFGFQGHGGKKKTPINFFFVFSEFFLHKINSFLLLIGSAGRFKPLEEIVCFKCGEAGHFANKCPKGHLAFLSNNATKGGGGGGDGGNNGK